MRKSGLADSPFFNMQPAPTPQPGSASLDKKQSEIAIEPNPDPIKKVIPTQSTPKMTSSENEAGSVRTYDRTDGRTPNDFQDLPRPRIKIRHAFNIYADQLQELQAMELDRVREGKKKRTLAAMVTKAIDDYLKTHRRLPNQS